MPPLSNPRHERFAQALFEGETADAAYEIAGFRANRGNASRLNANESILARLAELQTQAAKKSVVTVESLLDELEHARSRADGLDQLSAAVKAISEKAKISGLLINRTEVGGPGDFAQAETVEDVIEAAVEQLVAEGYRFDDADKAALTDLLLRHQDEQEEFLASCKAKVIAVRYANDPTELRHRQKVAAERQRQREHHRLLTVSNGAAKT